MARPKKSINQVVEEKVIEEVVQQAESKLNSFITKNPPKGTKGIALAQNMILRIAAVFGSGALAAIAGGAIINISIWKAAALAGIMAAAKVVEQLLRSWADDGVLTSDEISEAFGGTKAAPPTE